MANTGAHLVSAHEALFRLFSWIFFIALLASKSSLAEFLCCVCVWARAPRMHQTIVHPCSQHPRNKTHITALNYASASLSIVAVRSRDFYLTSPARFPWYCNYNADKVSEPTRIEWYFSRGARRRYKNNVCIVYYIYEMPARTHSSVAVILQCLRSWRWKARSKDQTLLEKCITPSLKFIYQKISVRARISHEVHWLRECTPPKTTFMLCWRW